MTKPVYLTIKQGNSIIDTHEYTVADLNRVNRKISLVAYISTFLSLLVLYNLLIVGNLISVSYTPTASMAPTLSVGEISFTRRVFGESDLHRGDIILFDPVTDQNRESAFAFGTGQKIFIKRLIGLPGEHICIINDVVYINGKPLDEPYATFPENRLCAEEDRDMDGITIPDGYYFFMGDNRDNSFDSRYILGVVPYENIRQKVVFHFDSISAKILGTNNDDYFINPYLIDAPLG